MSARRFPPHLALMGETEGIVDDEEGEGVSRRTGESKYAAEIVRLWVEGLTPAQIGKRIGMKNMATIRRVLMSNGVSEAEIDARRIRPRGTKGSRALLAPIEDPRITDFDPVDDEEGREETAPASWPEVAREIKCETCLHNHVCRWVKVCEQHPWIACRNWRRREAS
ncbi:MAG: hypothetical protein QME79_15065 [Bacillota bacterium]|nr:hypothetical protein [Bacillota bacterium]